MLISVRDPGWLPAGDMMVMGCGSRWGKCVAAARSLQAVHAGVAAAECREPARCIGVTWGAARTRKSCGRERLVAEFSERVVAAFQQFARDRQARAVVPRRSAACR